MPGDVNSDGYGDLLVGAFLHDGGGPPGADRGRAYLYLGSPSGLGANPAWVVDGDEDGASFGTSVASAGDVDNDGFGDVIVGAYRHDGGAGVGANRGRVYLFKGGPTGLSTTPSWTATGDEDEAKIGNSVAGAGDVDGDGYDDLVVGATHHSGGGYLRGRAYLYLGGAPVPGSTPAWTATGDEDDAWLGRSVASAGDVNGDGFADVIVGAYQHDAGSGPNNGQAYVYLGGPSGLASSPVWTGSGSQPNAEYGTSVASAGDVNADGYSDIIVGAIEIAVVAPGHAYVYLGTSSGPEATPAWSAPGDEDLSHFGISVSSAGDVNGDGYSDVIAGADQHSGGSGSARGQARVFLGCGGTACNPITILPGALPDAVVGAPYSETLTAIGGVAPYSFAVTSGSLPPGLALNGGTGAITGTVLLTGTWSFAVTASDDAGCTGSQGLPVDFHLPEPGAVPELAAKRNPGCHVLPEFHDDRR